MSAFDLTLLSLYRINNQEWPQLPGLLAQNPPRKAARGREQDRLIAYLTLAGNIMYSSSEYSQVVGQVAETFYNTAGSLTLALKTAAEALNAFLVERNMGTTSKGQYSIGALVLAALRNNQLFIAQSGPTHAFTLGSDPHHFYDSQLAGKGLGLSQTARVYLSQAQLNPGDRVLFCAALPPNWEKALAEERGHASVESTRRRLMAVTDTNVSAVLIQVSEGSGAMNIVQPVKEIPAQPAQQAAPAPAQRPAIQPASAAPAAGGLPAAALPVKEQAAPPGAPAVSLQAGAASQTGFKPRVEAPSSQSAQAASLPQASSAPRPVPVPPPAFEKPEEPAPRPSRRQRIAEPEYSPEPKVLITSDQKEQFRRGIRSTARFLARSIQAGREAGQRLAAGLGKFVPRLLPIDEEGAPASFFSRSLPVFIAIFVPVVIVVMAVLVYENIGKRDQFTIYYDNARASAEKVQTQADPVIQRKYWRDTLIWLDKAKEFGETEGSQQLRTQAQQALDALDRVARVEYKPAFSTGLSSNLQITHMAASDTDLYLLNAATGAVMRGTFNGRNFDLDGNFQCSPGTYDGIQVGQLIDMVPLPRSNPSTATLLGVDASGNLLYCIPGAAPRASFLQVPDTGWNRITAVAFDATNNLLYVLDAPARAVWVYFGTVEIAFPNKPYFYFESQVPLTLEQSIGMAVNGDDLYLLYADGHMTTCTLSRLSTSPTRCNDPAVFVDTRPGYQGGIRLTDGQFTQIAFTGPPDSSVALLEPYTQSIFHFNARALELQKQLQPKLNDKNESPLPAGEPITAMAFSPNKLLFIFVGGQVYFAINVQ